MRHPGATIGLLAIRVVVGVVFIVQSTGKFIDRDGYIERFERWDIPWGEVAVPSLGVVELVCGVLVLIGLFTRPAAVVIAALMVGAILTAGRVEGGATSLVLAPVMLVLAVAIAWWGPGAWSLDGRRHAATLEE